MIITPGWFHQQKKGGARKGKGGAKEVNAAAAAPEPEITLGTSAPAVKGQAAASTAPAAARGKPGGKGEPGKNESNFMNDLIHDESTRARVDVNTHDLIDIGELQQLDDISGLNDDEIDGFFSPAAGAAKGGGGGHGLGDLDLGEFGDLDMDAFASTPRATDTGADLSVCAPTPKAMDIDVPLADADAAIMSDVGGGADDAAALEAARKAEQAKDMEILAKPMTQLPPVVRRPGLSRGRNTSSGGPGVSDGVPCYYLSVTYGASAPPLTEVEIEAPDDANKDAAMLALPDGKSALKQEVENQGGNPAMRAMAMSSEMHGKMHGKPEQNAAHRHAAVKRHAEAAVGGSMINGATVKREAANLPSRTALSLYSVNKVWESSRSVCIDNKCSRSVLLIGAQRQRMQQGAGKLLPLEHLMVHQMALTCYDMPLTANLAAPNAPPVAMSMQAVRTAFWVRTQLIKDGLSSAAHLSLEHMMRAELGDDGRVMMALDPLSLPADATSVGYFIASVLPALDTLVPGLRREMKVLDISSLLGQPGRDVQEVAERLPAPPVVVGEAENHWVEVPPPALRWWEKLPLEPYGKKKNVVFCVICGSGISVQQASLPGDQRASKQSEQEYEASLFFKELSCVYEAANLGTHRHLESKDLPMEEPPNQTYAIVSVKAGKAGTGHGYGPGGMFEQACTRALRGLVKYFETDKSFETLPVLYLLEPDFALGNTWSATPPQHHQSPAQARAEWQRALAKAVAALALKCPRILDLVVQIVPVQRINIGRKMHCLLRDLAMAVYTKGRVRQRAKFKQADIIMDLEDETHSFFSASTLSINKKERVDRKLHEPLLTVPLPHTPDAAVPSSAAQGGMVDQEPVPMLHCGYTWSDDGLCLGAAITDTTGEMLETFTALFGGTQAEARIGGAVAGAESARDGAWRSMLQRLWNSIYEWICVSYDRPVRLVVGVLGGGMDLAKDLQRWRAILDKARCGAPGVMCCELMFVELGVVRSLQLLSRCDPLSMACCIPSFLASYSASWQAHSACPCCFGTGGFFEWMVLRPGAL